MPIQPAPIPRQERTQVGLRSLNQSSQPAALKKGGGKGRARHSRKSDGSDRLDRVSREDANLMVEEVGEESRHRRRSLQAEYLDDFELTPGHSSQLLPVDGRAFRIDDGGRKLPPAFADVEQGNLQDAWLLASFAAVAHAQPASILRRVHQTGRGTFLVVLGDQELKISATFPSEGYAETRPRGLDDTLWVALLEKAFAAWNARSYAQLETGNPGRAMELLLDRGSLRKRIRAADGQACFEGLREQRRAGRPVVLVSRPSGVPSPLVANHAYALVDAVLIGGRPVVKVYNPWGTRRASRPLDAVLHELDWQTHRSSFEFQYVGAAR